MIDWQLITDAKPTPVHPVLLWCTYDSKTWYFAVVGTQSCGKLSDGSFGPTGKYYDFNCNRVYPTHWSPINKPINGWHGLTHHKEINRV